jgi:hypothetical protein
MSNGGRVRLINVDWTTYNIDEAEELIGKLYSSRGIDASGNNTDAAVVTGRYHAAVISDWQLDRLSKFPELIVTYDDLTIYKWKLYSYFDKTLTRYDDPVITKISSYAFRGRWPDGFVINTPNVSEIKPFAFYACVPESIELGEMPLVTELPARWCNMSLIKSMSFPNCRTQHISGDSILGTSGVHNGCPSFKESFPNLTTLWNDSTTVSGTLMRNAYFRDFDAPNLVNNNVMPTSMFNSCSSFIYIYMPKFTGTVTGYLYTSSENGLLEYIVAPGITMSNGTITLPTKCKYIEIFHDNIVGKQNSRTGNNVEHLVLRDASNISTAAGSDGVFYGNTNCVNVYVARDLISEYQAATNWSLMEANNLCTFKALEDYTVDGTLTGEFNYSLINMEVYHES